MYEEEQLTDIVVEVDHGKTFSCHRNVLAAISPYFRYGTINYQLILGNALHGTGTYLTGFTEFGLP